MSGKIAADGPPPGPGLKAVTLTVAAALKLLEGTCAVRVVELTIVGVQRISIPLNLRSGKKITSYRGDCQRVADSYGLRRNRGKDRPGICD